MRISTSFLYQQSLNSIMARQSEAAFTQQQLATGKKLLRPSDNPMGAARLLDLKRSLTEIGQFQDNGELARNRLSYSEQILGSSGNVLQRVRELVLQANSDSQNAESRVQIAGEIDALRDELMALANTRDGQGNFLYAGYQSDVEPFTEVGGSVRYRGDDGRREVRIGDDYRIADSDPGSEIFMRIPTGDGRIEISADSTNVGSLIVGSRSLSQPALWDGGDYTLHFTTPTDYEIVDGTGTTVGGGVYTDGDAIEHAGMTMTLSGAPAIGDRVSMGPSRSRDIFRTLEAMVSVLESSAVTSEDRAAQTNILNEGLLNLDQAFGRLLETRASVGTRLQSIEREAGNQESLEVDLSTGIADLESLDYAEAISRLAQQSTTLEAAQQSFVRLSRLNLFRLL